MAEVRPALLFPQVFNGGDSNTTQLLDSTTPNPEMIAAVWTCNKAGSVDRIALHVTAVTGSPSYDVRLETVDSGVPTGTLFGTNTNVTFSPTGTGIQTVTLTSAATVVAGDKVACVIKSTTADGSNNATFGFRDPELGVVPFQDNAAPFTDIGVGTWTWVADCARFGPMYSDDDRMWGVGIWNIVDSTTTFDSADTPDEIGICFTARRQVDMIGAAISVRISSTTSDFDIVLYDSGGTSLASVSVDVSKFWTSTTSARNMTFYFSSAYTLAADTTYYLLLKPTSATQTIILQVFDDFPSAEGVMLAAFGARSLKYASRTDGGSITTDATKMVPLTPIVDLATGAAAGGGTPYIIGG